MQVHGPETKTRSVR